MPGSFPNSGSFSKVVKIIHYSLTYLFVIRFFYSGFSIILQYLLCINAWI